MARKHLNAAAAALHVADEAIGMADRAIDQFLQYLQIEDAGQIVTPADRATLRAELEAQLAKVRTLRKGNSR